jgi:phage gp16-like protein
MTDRRALQKKIHVACRELGLDGEARRELQEAATGKASMLDMSEGDLRLVLDRLVKAGFKGPSKRRPAAARADVRLVHVLWHKLGEAGVLEKPGRAGLNAFIRSRFETTWGAVPADVDMLRDHKQIDMVVEALKQWGRRAGVPLDRRSE